MKFVDDDDDDDDEYLTVHDLLVFIYYIKCIQQFVSVVCDSSLDLRLKKQSGGSAQLILRHSKLRVTSCHYHIMHDDCGCVDLLYALEVCNLYKRILQSLDFTVNRFFMKLFGTLSNCVWL